MQRKYGFIQKESHPDIACCKNDAQESINIVSEYCKAMSSVVSNLKNENQLISLPETETRIVDLTEMLIHDLNLKYQNKKAECWKQRCIMRTAGYTTYYQEKNYINIKQGSNIHKCNMTVISQITPKSSCVTTKMLLIQYILCSKINSINVKTRMMPNYGLDT